MKISKSDFRSWEISGENEFYLDKVVSKFDNDCAIYQNKESFIFAQLNGVKTSISKVQALQLIDLLKLYPVKCPPFKNATTWRLENVQK